MITVLAEPNDVVSTRMPTGAERRLLGINAADVPILSLQRPGHAEELFDARAVMILATGGPAARWPGRPGPHRGSSVRKGSGGCPLR